MAFAEHTALAIEQVLVTGGTATTGEAPGLRLAAAMLLAETLDLRDAGTAEHSRTVGRFARDTAPYRPGMAPEGARAELERCSGAQFDPTVVEAFFGTLAASRVRPRLGAPAV